VCLECLIRVPRISITTLQHWSCCVSAEVSACCSIRWISDERTYKDDLPTSRCLLLQVQKCSLPSSQRSLRIGTMSSLKPITLYSHAGGPNPWKVAIVLNELGVPYTNTFPKVKEQPYLSINPNGRAPAIEDPNTGITLWESAAIIKYLIDTYDKDGKISYSSSPEKYLQDQWLAFQISGQGPYFGQVSSTRSGA
jgi:hypothetical protein